MTGLSPIAVLYFFTDDINYPIIDQDVCKQQLSIEQLGNNILDSEQFIAQARVDYSKPEGKEVIQQLRTYIYNWRNRLIEYVKSTHNVKQTDYRLYQLMDEQEQKQISNIDEALLKSFLYDKNNDNNQQIISSLLENYLFIDYSIGTQLLSQFNYQQQLIKYLKQQGRYKEALYLLINNNTHSQLSDDQCKQIVDFLRSVALGPKVDDESQINQQLVLLHQEFYYKLFYSSFATFLTLFDAPVAASLN